MGDLITAFILLVLFFVCAFVGWLFWKIVDYRWRKLEKKERAAHPDFFDREANLRILNKRKAQFLTQEREIKKEIAALREKEFYAPRVTKYEFEIEIDRLCWNLRDLEIKRKKIETTVKSERKWLKNYREVWNLRT